MAEYSGDGSYLRLITDNYGIRSSRTGETMDYLEYNNKARSAEKIKQTLFSLLFFGRYDFNGDFSGRSNGHGWFYTTQPSEILDYRDNLIFIQSVGQKGRGLSVRCVARISLISIKL